MAIYRVQIQRNVQQAPPPPPPLVRNVTESGPADLDGANGAGAKPKAHQRSAAAVGAAAAPAEANAKIGRNDPCWCGSGKKYKRCHGR
jgi:preprotein translocase subunit SecA